MGQIQKDIGRPLIKNFSSKDYPFASSQNWSTVQDNRGVIYVANTSGVLIYDGNHWELISTSSAVRSLAFDSISGNVYVGIQDDFGMLFTSAKGHTSYVSLFHSLAPNQTTKTVWYIHATPKGIFFTTDDKIYRLLNGKLKTWVAKTSFNRSFFTNGKLLVCEQNVGIEILENDYFRYVEGSDIFSTPFDVPMIVPYSHDKLLIASRKKGFYTMQLFLKSKETDVIKAAFFKIKSEIGNLLNDYELNAGIRLANGNFALATTFNGLITVNPQGEVLSVVNKKNGLSNELVYHLFEDPFGNIWLCTDGGISVVNYAIPLFKFDISGSINSIINYQNKLYIGGVNGLQSYNPQINQFDKTTSDKQDVLTLEIYEPKHTNINPILLIGTRSGIYGMVDGVNTSLYQDIDNIYKLYVSKKHPGTLYAGHSNGISIFHFEGTKLIFDSQISNIDYAIRSVAEDNNGCLWLSTESDGIIYVQIKNGISGNKKNNHFNLVFFNQENGFPDNVSSFIYEYENQLVFLTGEGLYQFKQPIDLTTVSMTEIAKIRFTKFKGFSKLFNKNNRQVFKLKSAKNGNIWMQTRLKNGVHESGVSLKLNQNKYLWDPIALRILPAENLLDIYINKDSSVWFAGTDILYRFNNNKSYNYKVKYNAMIRKVINGLDTVFYGDNYQNINVKEDTLERKISLTQPAELIQTFPYEKNDFSFSYAATSFFNPKHKFSVYLKGEDNKWSDWSAENSKSYMNLEPGTYIFMVKAKNVFGTISTVATYQFNIIPPWYRTTLAYVVYFILAIAFVIAVVIISNRGLKRIIDNQTAELIKQKDEIENKNKEITDSIYYAKRIQDAIMPANEYIKSLFPESFVFHKPKDIVSGDFYWANGSENESIIAAIDCTGHGVPGAFMSMIGNDYLNDIIIDSKVHQTNEVLDRMRAGIIMALKQKGESGESKDGMDLALVCFNQINYTLDYAGANNPLYIVREKSLPPQDGAVLFTIVNSNYNLYEIKANKFPVGIHMGTTLQPFKNHRIQLYKGDSFYIASDGYADQFGGPNGKKLKYNQFKQFILESMFLTMEEQKIYLTKKLADWQGDLEQVDDVLVIGVKVL